MKFKDALLQLREGKTAYHKGWQDTFIKLNKDYGKKSGQHYGYVFLIVEGDKTTPWRPSPREALSNHWEIKEDN